jgi:uncharacterized membrane protein YfcA
MSVSYIVAGFAVGLLVGLTGVGGGSLMTPILTLMFGVTPTVAVGTDLAFASVTKIAGTVAHRSKGNVHWSIVKQLCIGALPAAVLTTLALKHFGGLGPEAAHVIRYSIAGSVFLTVIALIFRTHWHSIRIVRLKAKNWSPRRSLLVRFWVHWLQSRLSAQEQSAPRSWFCFIPA